MTSTGKTRMLREIAVRTRRSKIYQNSIRERKRLRRREVRRIGQHRFNFGGMVTGTRLRMLAGKSNDSHVAMVVILTDLAVVPSTLSIALTGVKNSACNA
jgi:hypothetical protein